MLLGKLTKQSVEKQNYFIRYDEYLQDGEVLTDVIGTSVPLGIAVDPLVVDNFTLIGPVIMVNKKDIEFWLEGGLDGMNYKLEITATTSLDNIKQDELKVKVKDI